MYYTRRQESPGYVRQGLRDERPASGGEEKAQSRSSKDVTQAASNDLSLLSKQVKRVDA